MVSVTVLCVGKLKERFYQDACDEYRKRLSGLCKLTVTELPEYRLPEQPSPAQIGIALEKECSDILAHLPRGGVLVAMCIEGKTLSSQMLAQQISQWTLNGSSHITFIIGGSYGLHQSVKDRAQFRLSMSPMTFPHHLARVMLLEQIYRGFQIIQGSPYHK